MTYKRDVADARESPSLDVLSLLLSGARATYHDPYIQTLTPPDRSRDPEPHPHPRASPTPTTARRPAHRPAHRPPGAPCTPGRSRADLRSVDLIPALEGADCVVICTDHSAYDWEDVVARARLLVDTRNALRHVRAARAEAGSRADGSLLTMPPSARHARPPPRRHPALRVLLLCFLLGIARSPSPGPGCTWCSPGRSTSPAWSSWPRRPWDAAAGGGAGGHPGPGPEAPPTPQPEWAGRDRVNVLLLGNDRREGESDVPRTDTIMVLTIDTAGRTAGLLSCPATCG